MNKISHYIDSLLDLPPWIGFPIFFFSIAIPLLLVILFLSLLIVVVSPWFIFLPIAIWAACAINWWLKNK